MPPVAPTHLTRRNRRERLWLLLAMVAIGAWAVANRLGRLDAIEKQEGTRLAMQVQGIALNLEQQLLGVQAALQGVRDDLPQWMAAELPRGLGRRMDALCAAMPGVRSMMLVDAGGAVLAVGRPQGVDLDQSGSAWFATVKARPQAGALFVSAPYRDGDGQWSMNLAVSVGGPRGAFAGAVAATLDGAYFKTLLESAVYAADMSVRIIHGDGLVLIVSPADASVEGSSLAQPQTRFARHLAAGQETSVQRGRTAAGDERLVALRTLRPPRLHMDKPLLIGISRQVAAMQAAWRQQTELVALLYLGGALAAMLAMLTLQRRRADVEAGVAERQARQAAEAERLRLALHGGDLALWDVELPSRRATTNERWCTMLGYAPGEKTADGDGWELLLHPDDRERALATMQAHLDGRSVNFESRYRMRHRDGHWVWVLDRGRVVARDAGGAPLRMVGTHMDITASVQAEQAIRSSEQSLAITLQSIGDAVIATDADGRITRINDAARRLTAWPGDSALGRPLAEVFRIYRAGTREPERDPVARVLASGETVGLANGTLLVARDGSEYQIADSAAPIRTDSGEVLGVVLVFSDVTEQYRMVQALRMSEQKSRALLASLRSGVVVHASDARVLDANPAACQLLGMGLEQIRGKSATDSTWLFLEEDGTPMPQARHPVHQVLGGGAVRDLVLGLRRADLPYPVWALCSAFALRDAAGAVQEVVVTYYEFTERKQAEDAVRAAQDELAATLRAIPDLLFDVDLEGRIHGFHSPRVDLLAMPPAQFLGRPMAEVVPPGTVAVVMQGLREAHAHGHAGGLQYELALPQGPRWFEISVARKATPEGQTPRFVMLVRDISERRQGENERLALERQLREAQKIESIGTLAGGIAHDFNNILPAILGNVALARQQLSAHHPAQAYLEQINKAGLRARTLVQQILTFSRRQPQELVSQALQPVLEETLSLLRAALPAAVRLDSVITGDPAAVEVDATQLQQVVMNLCTNAWHALPQGRGRIEVGLEVLSAAAAARHALDELQAGPCMHLWVGDDGSGMDAQTRVRIFDPFFTTKPVGQGTGLGLSVVHGIVRGHRGGIRVDSAPGRGSTFHVLLPLAAGTPSQPGALEAPAVPPAQGQGEHVLYVDDDEVMSLMVQRLLQLAGYSATTLGSPLQALALVREQPMRFDLVISDYNMPGMSGTELALQLAHWRPGLPVIITSGHISDELRQQAAGAGVRALLHKEQTLENLAGLVRQVLTSAE